MSIIILLYLSHDLGLGVATFSTRLKLFFSLDMITKKFDSKRYLGTIIQEDAAFSIPDEKNL